MYNLCTELLNFLELLLDELYTHTQERRTPRGRRFQQPHLIGLRWNHRRRRVVASTSRENCRSWLGTPFRSIVLICMQIVPMPSLCGTVHRYGDFVSCASENETKDEKKAKNGRKIMTQKRGQHPRAISSVRANCNCTFRDVRSGSKVMRAGALGVPFCVVEGSRVQIYFFLVMNFGSTIALINFHIMKGLYSWFISEKTFEIST